MNSPLFDMSQYQSATTRSYSTDWIDATGADTAWDELELHSDLKNSTAEPDGNAQDNHKGAPTMTEQETPDSSRTSVG